MTYHKNIFAPGGFKIPTTQAYLCEEGQSRAVWVGSDEELSKMESRDEVSHFIESYPDTELSDEDIASRLVKVYSFGIEEILEDYSEEAIMDGISFWWQGEIYHTDGEFDSSKPFEPQYTEFIKFFTDREEALI